MRESWMVIAVRRELNEKAIVPVSEEAVEYAVELRKREIKRKKALGDIAFDIEFEIQRQALRGINN